MSAQHGLRISRAWVGCVMPCSFRLSRAVPAHLAKSDQRLTWRGHSTRGGGRNLTLSGDAIFQQMRKGSKPDAVRLLQNFTNELHPPTFEHIFLFLEELYTTYKMDARVYPYKGVLIISDKSDMR